MKMGLEGFKVPDGDAVVRWRIPVSDGSRKIGIFFYFCSARWYLVCLCVVISGYSVWWN
jgi:hypothetical protein